jgi:hypothetical protein
LEHHLVTDRTSFVAVEEKTITEPGKANRKLVVPVDMPQGVSWEAYENDPAGATNFGQLRLGGYPTGNSYSKYASPRRGARFDFAPNTFGGEVFAKRHPNKLGFDVIYGGRVPFDKLVINGGGAGAMIGLSPSAKLSTAFKAGQQSIAVRVPDPKKLDDQLQALLVNALIDDSFSNSSVRVLVEFTESPNMLTDLEKLGMKDGRVVHNNIIGIIPMSKLAMICDLPNIKLIKLER